MKWPLSICHLKHGGQFHYELPQSLDFLRVACSPPCHSGACRTPDGTTAPAICLRNRQRIKEAVRYASYPAYHPTHPWLEWSHHNISQHTQINQDVQLCAWFCRITWMYIYMYIYIVYIYIYIYDYMSDEIPMPWLVPSSFCKGTSSSLWSTIDQWFPLPFHIRWASDTAINFQEKKVPRVMFVASYIFLTIWSQNMS